MTSGRPLLAWYGDDFTGAAAVAETLAFAGVPAVLFLDIPKPEQIRRFAAARAFGIAGIARAKSPSWMDRALPPIFRALAAFNAAITQYKVCSTFDSSPETGSIGHAAALAAPILAGAWTPLLAASPAVGRYQAFGNLFARAGGNDFGAIWRLDRHPTTRRHPVTPMTESDLRLHLARQTGTPTGLVDLVAMKEGRADAALAAARAAGAEIIALDVVDDETLAVAGRLIWEHRGERLFAIGSQGIEEALIAHWRRTGLLGAAPAPPHAGPVARLAAVSGSCSPLTAAQIAWAETHGFRAIRLDASAAVDPAHWDSLVHQASAAALASLGQGADPIVFTARGPDDPAASALATALATTGADADTVHQRIGDGLGRILAELRREARLRRLVIAGGDTSGRAAGALGIAALTAAAPTTAGAALFEAHGPDEAAPKLEIALKGGQMGGEDYFARIKAGQ
ncbi:MAG TPA: four-carbon acid sugar kinase family protein [Acetobacteraceae bacterium]|nr:four-carbon acid sugar kinase family protein [Acetobacteraceae bacterium]